MQTHTARSTIYLYQQLDETRPTFTTKVLTHHTRATEQVRGSRLERLVC